MNIDVKKKQKTNKTMERKLLNLGKMVLFRLIWAFSLL